LGDFEPLDDIFLYDNVLYEINEAFL
jgi:hypothetical protein